jgi:hypothetical protein
MPKQPFRITLWFKKGAADAEQAAEAAAEGDALHPGAVDLLPAEDRYLDDGSVTRDDSRTFGLRTGRTTYLPRVATAGGTTVDVDVAPLIGDLKRGRRAALAVLGASLAAACALAVAYLM